MVLMSAAITLFAILSVGEAQATRSDEQLAKMFSPILVLTEETNNRYDETVPIRVIKPEPVEIVGADSLSNLYFTAKSLGRPRIDIISDTLGINWHPQIDKDRIEANCNVDFSENFFAFLTSNCNIYGSRNGRQVIYEGIWSRCQSRECGLPKVPVRGLVFPGFFDYPGKTAAEWNSAYFGEGNYAGTDNKYRGSDFPNTAYVHIYERTINKYKAKYDPITVIQYKYFYPYNDWWNNHEGDWQGIDVVVSSRDPTTAEFLGVEYRFHGVWLSYYKDYDDKPGITDSFVFNAVGDVRLAARTHPVAYIAAGSHAAYPIGGDINLFSKLEAIVQAEGEEGVSGAIGVSIGDWEYMSHTGLVLSTLADGSHSDLWEGYNLVLLPDPDPTNTNNMGLDPDMSWLGAQIRWGTPQVDGPVFASGEGNESPHGPYNSEAGSWGNLKLFDGVGKIGFKIPIVGGLTRVNAFDPFHHSDLYAPDSSPLSVTEYHHWAIIGDETWSGTVSLRGDVVVFPGATLTIQDSTTVTFPSRSDRHQFKEGNDRLSEIFVYGTLKSEGTSSRPVVLRGPNPPDEDDAQHWGGIRMMAGGTDSVGVYTQIYNAPPPTVRPINLTAAVGDGAVTLRWDEPSPSDPSITGWEYHTKLAGVEEWGPWMAVSGRATRQVEVSPLAYGVRHQFEVRAVNANVTGGGPASEPVSASLLEVAFSAANTP